MQLQRTEIPNNTPEQTRDYLVRALELVEDVQPPDDLRAAVFEAAFSAVSGKQIVMEQAQPIDLGALASMRARQ